MTLASDTRGSGPTLTFLHGFTQTRESWRPVIEELEGAYSCTTIDAPGHGESSNGKLTLVETGDAIAAVMPTGTLIGYSMGARMALHTVLQHPNKIKRLVLVSGTAGIDEESERQSRIASDETLADHIESIGVEQFIHEWLRNPLFAGLSESNAQIAERLRNTPTGLADSLRYAGTGTQTPLWSRLSEITIPVLLVAGELDPKFVALAERMHHELPFSQLEVVEGAGHTVHLEKTDAFCEILISWLDATQSHQ